MFVRTFAPRLPAPPKLAPVSAAREAFQGLAAGALAGAGSAAVGLWAFDQPVEAPAVVLAYGAAFGAGSGAVLGALRARISRAERGAGRALALLSGPLAVAAGGLAFALTVRLLTGHAPWETGWSSWLLRFGPLGIAQRGLALGLGVSAAELALGPRGRGTLGLARARRVLATAFLAAVGLAPLVLVGLVHASTWLAGAGAGAVAALASGLVATLRGERAPAELAPVERWADAPARSGQAPVSALAGCALATLVGLAPVAQRAKSVNEAEATRALRAIATAQSIYREGGKDPSGELRYGSLEDLGRVGLIDPELASGVKSGYRFAALPSLTTSEFLWFATANPIVPGETGDRAFATNPAGITWYRRADDPIPMDRERCELPGPPGSTGDHALVPG